MRSMTVAVKLAALLMMAPAVFAAGAKGDPAKGKLIVDQVCAACHGADGNSVVSANPSLAGQHPEYIVKQLTEFKSQKRKNPVMLGMATPLSPADMANVAAYFSQQTPKAKGASNKELIEAGKKIYRGGVASKNVPACMACHGPAGAGIPGQYPRLSSQHAAYTTAQLTAFRVGERANNQVMSEIAAKLSDQEIKAVSEYIQAIH
ncbi:cytochrome c4 [Chitinibacter fontanus]|uniref:Cytochrome c4 n=1 Tax=Chitinibacter fontanus TaxID=1737446 RepID=A0A7D5ZER2_9NEIS|nr:c-type cytochrome [Chitinibacter fontanus]QLI81744.1 cytochrome c4 [Chitinibacter fontanus]